MGEVRKVSMGWSELHVEEADEYTATIELSNACREFYRNRVKKTEHFKQNINKVIDTSSAVSKKRTSIDDAMDKLTIEMASLMDQDLLLMKQLLTLNEAIEDLKTKRLYHMSKDSLCTSSQELSVSEWSVSNTDMYETDEESDTKGTNTSVSLPVSLTKETPYNARLCVAKRTDVSVLMNADAFTAKHGQQRSIDSGYGDDDHRLAYHKRFREPVEVMC